MSHAVASIGMRRHRPGRRNSARAALSGLVLACLPAVATAQDAARDDAPGLQRAAPLAAIAPGAVLELQDGTRLRLAFLRLPDPMTDLPAGSDGDAGEVEAWSRAAVEAVAAALADAPVAYRPAAEAPDRYGARAALVELPDGGLLQERLLRAGLARLDLAALALPRAADGDGDGGAAALAGPALLTAEREARLARRGLWAAAPYRVRSPWEVAGWLGTFQLVVGRIHAAAPSGDNFFVNFGADHRTDFTVLFRGPAARRFRDAAGEAGALAGCPVLVRGWIEYWNGPLVAATDPAQVEFLEECA